MTLEIPIAITNPLNGSQGTTMRGRMAVAGRRAKQRATIELVLKPQPKRPLPCVVILTRIAPRRFDGDGLAAAFKGVRDEIAKWLGVDDRDERIVWHYLQAKSLVPRAESIRITVRGRTQWDDEFDRARARVLEAA